MADGTIFNIKKSMNDLGDKISEEQKTEINSLIDKVTESISKKEVESVSKLVDELNEKFHKISQELYNTGEPTEVDPNEVQFEEVK